MFERSLVPGPCRCAEKVGGWAQVLQRGTPTRGDRAKAPNYVADARWRSQPATVKEPENSSLRRSRKWSHCKTGTDSRYKRGQVGEQVTTPITISASRSGHSASLSSPCPRVPRLSKRLSDT